MNFTLFMHALDVGFAKAGGPSSGSLTTATLSNIAVSDPHENFEMTGFWRRR